MMNAFEKMKLKGKLDVNFNIYFKYIDIVKRTK